MYDLIFQKIDTKSIELAAQFINNYSNLNNNIYTLGVGKSSHIANIFSDQLKLLSISCFNMNCTNLLHGNIGMIKENDLVFIISKSGKTLEINNSVIKLKEKKCIIILISMNSNYNKLYHYNISLPTVPEIDENNLIPTNSLIVFIYFFNKVILNLIKLQNLKSNELIQANHPSGCLGK